MSSLTQMISSKFHRGANWNKTHSSFQSLVTAIKTSRIKGGSSRQHAVCTTVFHWDYVVSSGIQPQQEIIEGLFIFTWRNWRISTSSILRSNTQLPTWTYSNAEFFRGLYEPQADQYEKPKSKILGGIKESSGFVFGELPYGKHSQFLPEKAPVLRLIWRKRRISLRRTRKVCLCD